MIIRGVRGHHLRLCFGDAVVRVAAPVEAGIGAQRHSDWNILWAFYPHVLKQIMALRYFFIFYPKCKPQMNHVCNIWHYSICFSISIHMGEEISFSYYIIKSLYILLSMISPSSADKSICTFLRLMNRTHSTQVVRKGSKHTAHLPHWDSIVCISGGRSEAIDIIDGLFKCSFRMNLAACSCAENNIISCQSTHLFKLYFVLTPASLGIVIITTCLFSLLSLCLINWCIYSLVDQCPSFRVS